MEINKNLIIQSIFSFTRVYDDVHVTKNEDLKLIHTAFDLYIVCYGLFELKVHV